MAILQELLEINEQVLLERVDVMLKHLHQHFSNYDNYSPVKSFSQTELENLAYELAGLNFLTEEKNLHKITEFDDEDYEHFSKKYYMFLSDIDEVNEKPKFKDRSKTASEFLEFIGQKYAASDSKKYLKLLTNLKTNVKMLESTGELVRLISKLERKYIEVLAALKLHFSKR